MRDWSLGVRIWSTALSSSPLGRADERDLVGKRAGHGCDRFVALAFEEQPIGSRGLPASYPIPP